MTEACIAEAVQQVGLPQRRFTQLELADCLLLPMVNEGAHILAEGVALRASDIDLVEVHGYGVPRRSGGPMQWATARGLGQVVDDLRALSQAGLASPPADYLVQAAAQGGFAA